MAIRTARVEGNATVDVDWRRCVHCGLCARVCKGAPLVFEAGKLRIEPDRLFGCIGCGQCVCVCPENCITVEGRDISPDDFLPIPPVADRADYESLQALLLSRRSVRDFQRSEPPHDLLEQIVAAAALAPSGIPPTDTGVLVLAGRQKVREFRDDLLGAVRSYRWMMTPLALTLLRPFIGKETYESFRSFISPVADLYLNGEREGRDWFFYDAPAAFYFYTSLYADTADPYIAATYAMVAAQALGLGACMLGFPGYIVKYSRDVRKKYDLPDRLQPGIAMICGYPAVRYRKTVRRTLARVQYA